MYDDWHTWGVKTSIFPSPAAHPALFDTLKEQFYFLQGVMADFLVSLDLVKNLQGVQKVSLLGRQVLLP